MAVAVAAATTVGLSGCAGFGGGGLAGRDDTNAVNVLMVNNPQMVDLQRLTSRFTQETGITVNYTVLPENDVRAKISQEFSAQAGLYDVASLSNFEIPIYGRAGWVAPLNDFIAADSGFDQDDIMDSMQQSLSVDGTVYGQPFYGESSFLMYRKDLTDAKGITVPSNPTWDQVAELAAQLDGAEPGMKGICLRGMPGWGQVFAPLTTVVNTFGGTWFDANWAPQVNAAPFKDAVNFYVTLLKEHGQAGAAQSGFTECLNAMVTGRTAMWYDATSAAGSLEAEGSQYRGKFGYVAAPVKETQSSGWLYTWAWAIQNGSPRKDAAWKFISWASGKDYEKLVGQQVGWANVPAGKRASTYQIPEYLQVASAFAEPTKLAIENADPNNPGVQPRPAPGIQFVGIPEFPALGTRVSQDISAVIAGQMSVDEALDRGQAAAELVASRYQK
ncbi:putative ABC transporter substrate-binding protein [Kineosphaera limosa NBRC 100340]|uniref:Putative ABC transporter substrate-binding protein n=1 Tax=Kineosphaera limosa NBRC 100340 TaxID=1184609 RepID=K6W5R1_9MICO|nr:putative ABC transporter substrate-binding protein [Kineosphaera limosa NBRC 100340]